MGDEDHMCEDPCPGYIAEVIDKCQGVMEEEPDDEGMYHNITRNYEFAQQMCQPCYGPFMASDSHGCWEDNLCSEMCGYGVEKMQMECTDETWYDEDEQMTHNLRQIAGHLAGEMSE